MRQSRRSLLLAAAAAPLFAQREAVRLPKKLRLGLIGFDGHVGEILRVLPQLPDVELCAVADAASSPDAIAASAKNAYVAAARRYGSALELLDKEALDLAAICNHDGDRAGAILACSERKLDAIAEKPLAVRRADWNAVRDAVVRSKIRLGMLLPMRFDPPYLAMKRIVASGQVGEVLQIDAQKSYQLGKRPEWQKNAATYGSTILWIGIHMIDLMTWTTGRRFAEAASFQGRAGFPEMRDMETVTASAFRLDNGGTATLRMDYLRPALEKEHGDDRLRIAGVKGVVEYQERTGVTLMTDRAGFQVIHDLPPQGSVFLDFLLSTYGHAAPQLTWGEIARANEYTIAADEAARLGRTVKIQPE